MVFDWFRRNEAAAPPPSDADVEAMPQADAPPAEAKPTDPDDPAAPAAAAATPPAAELPAPPDRQPSPAAAPSAEPAAGGVDQDALEWARQAYARLKAQQEAARQAAPEPSPPEPSPPAPPPAAAAAAPAAPAAPAEAAPPALAATDRGLPESPPEPPLTPPGPAAPAATEPAAVTDAPSAPAVAEPPPVEPPALDLRAAEPPLPSPAPPAPLSLLEQAAAQRQERLRQLSADDRPAPGPAAPAAEAAELTPAPLAPAPDRDQEAEPTLGAFDDSFTWSAEVLAAQGRSVEDVSLEEIDWLSRLRRGLEKTRKGFVTQLLETLGDDPLSPEQLDDLETTLLRADVGVQATDLVLEALRRRLNEEVVDPAEGLRFLKEQLRNLLDGPTRTDGRSVLAPSRERLNVWLLVGVNGVGKTTTLGKLANLAVRSGYSCLIAAADTFRAAAVQQVTVWGERSGVPVISNASPHADPAAVVYDAIGAAKARGTDLVLVDTAGRLQTKHNLMEELAKVRRIVDRLAPDAAIESLLVLDASQGQNGLRQAMAFAPAAGLTGVVLTKLDGSARGGVAIAVAHDAGLPIRFIGAGEGLRDLRPFNSYEFVEALLAH